MSSATDLMQDSLLEDVPRKEGKIVLGPCQLVRKLGQGAMGAVYEGHHVALDSRVAVKVLPDYLAAKDPKFIERFYREARTAFKVRHPGVVSVLDVGQDETSKVYYLVMEFVEGESAGDLLKRLHKINEATALDIAIGVAEALDAALKVKVIHRDIKPDNIMISKDGKVKLADMGLAKQQAQTDDDGNAAGAGMTMANVAMGTPYYMSPEAAQDAKNVDHRADIYSLGASLFELVTGDVPYRDKTTFAIMMKHVQEPMPNPKELNPHLSDELCRILGKMLEKRTTARYQTPAELLKDLNALRAQYKPEAGLMSLYGPHAGDGSVIIEDGGATLAISHADQQKILTMRSHSGVAAHAQTSASEPGAKTPASATGAAVAVKSANTAPVKETPALEQPPVKSSNNGLIIFGVIALVLLFIVGGIALAAWYLFGKSEPTTTTNNPPHPVVTPPVGPGPVVPGPGPVGPGPVVPVPGPVGPGPVVPDLTGEANKLAEQNALLKDARTLIDQNQLDAAKEKLDAAQRIPLITPNPVLAEVQKKFDAANAALQEAKAKFALAERNYTDKQFPVAYDNAKAALDLSSTLIDAQALMGLSAKQTDRTPEAKFQLTEYLKKAVPEAKYKYVQDARAALTDIAAAELKAGDTQKKAEAKAFIDGLVKQDKFSAASSALDQQAKLFSAPELAAYKTDIEAKRAARAKIVEQEINAQIAKKEYPAADTTLTNAAGILTADETTRMAKAIADARAATEANQALTLREKLRAAAVARAKERLAARLTGKDYTGAQAALAELKAADAAPADIAAATQQVEALKPHAASLDCKTIGMEMLYIPAGSFTMGSAKGDPDEGPPKKITLTQGFYMAKTEVTYTMYKQFLKDNPDHDKPSDEKTHLLIADGPIIGISFNDANDFCVWLSQKEGRTYLLPSEAQWEYAARGDDQRRFPWGSKAPTTAAEMSELLKCQGTSKKGLQPVGSFPKGASPFGILDLAGNASEWCRDAYAATIYTAPEHPDTDPLVVGVGEKYPVNAKARIVRGGDYNTEIGDCRTTKRGFQNAENNECNNTIRLITREN